MKNKNNLYFRAIEAVNDFCEDASEDLKETQDVYGPLVKLVGAILGLVSTFAGLVVLGVAAPLVVGAVLVGGIVGFGLGALAAEFIPAIPLIAGAVVTFPFTVAGSLVGSAVSGIKKIFNPGQRKVPKAAAQLTPLKEVKQRAFAKISARFGAIADRRRKVAAVKAEPAKALEAKASGSSPS
jgi:hypothetical protein